MTSHYQLKKVFTLNPYMFITYCLGATYSTNYSNYFESYANCANSISFTSSPN